MLNLAALGLSSALFSLAADGGGKTRALSA